MRRVELSWVIVMWAAACSSTPEPVDGGTCVRGTSQACACVDGRQGAQVCGGTGGFGACVCAAADAAGLDAEVAVDTVADVGPSPRDAEPDAGENIVDASDAAADVGPPDAGLPAFCEAFPAGFVRVEAGRFQMGAPPEEPTVGPLETPRHTVVLTRAFYMQATEVTQAEWLRVMATNPSFHTGCPDCPVEQVSWFDATDYANALSSACGLPACYPADRVARRSYQLDLDCTGYRLPTEAEWEYAARAGTTTAYYVGEVIQITGRDPRLEQTAWLVSNAGISSQPVRGRTPNPWGLFDIYGNVREWLSDGRREYGTSTVTDPNTALDAFGPAIRGCSFISEPSECRSALRIFSQSPQLGGGEGGLRLVRVAR